MKKFTLLFILFGSLALNQCYAQVTFPWATGVGGYSTYNAHNKITRDDVGNIYAVGTFTSTRTFGSFSLTAVGSNDLYVAKFDPTGNCMWAIKGGGSFSTAAGSGIAIDNNYNIYITGTFTNSFTLGVFTVFATVSSAADIFIARLDNNGNPIWLNTVTGNSEKDASYLHCDGNNLYMTGYFKGTTTFGTPSVSTPSTIYSEIFLAKYDLTGSCTWVVKAGGNQDDKGFCVKTDNLGNILLTGTFQLIGTFGTNTVTSTQYDDVFVAKYDQVGNNLWVKKGGGAGNDQGYGIACDNSNNIFVAGTFSSPTAFFGTLSVTDNGYGNIFTAKYDVNGTSLWVKSAGGNQSDQAFDVTTDSSGSCYVTGIFQGAASFFPNNITSTGSNDAFVTKYNGTTGANIWATKIGSSNTDYGKSIVNVGGGSVIVAGDFTTSMTVGSNTLSSPGAWSTFIVQINGGTVGIESPSEISDMSIYPNPANDFIQIDAAYLQNKIKEVDFYNSMGQLILKNKYSMIQGSLKIDLDQNIFKQGLYWIKVKSDKSETIQKIIIQKQ